MKLVVEEAGAADAEAAWLAADRRAASRLLYPEARAALARAARMGRLPAGQLDPARRRVDRLFEEVDRIELTASVARLADEHALRAYDAVHLASLETVADADTVLLAADGDLRRAARARGFAVLRAAP